MEGTVTVALYFVAWASIHSLLASLKAKGWVERRFGAAVFRYYRAGFVLFAAGTLIPIVWLVFSRPGTILYSVSPPWRYVMTALQAAGAIGLLWTVSITGTADFLGIPGAVGKGGGRLQTAGPYGYVRHPMYTAGLLAMWFSPVMRLDVLVLFVLMTAYFAVGSIHEELLLLDEFGEDYAVYRRAVPRFIPRSLQPYRPAPSRPDDGPIGEP